MNQFALIIGIEVYKEEIRKISFVENDLIKFQECLIKLGFDPSNITCLLNSNAGKKTIESELARLVRQGNKEDELLLYFAGQGLCINGSNYVCCYDTLSKDLINSCISLQWIMDLFKTSLIKRKIVFFDSSFNGKNMDGSIEEIEDSMNESEFEGYFLNSDFETGFVSCRAREDSYSSPNLSHGIWSYHLMEALSGKVINMLDQDKCITSRGLQEFLTMQVPKTLRMEHPESVIQRPICFGNSSKNLKLFNLETIIFENEAKRKSSIKRLKSVSLLGRRGGKIQELIGFIKKQHRIPNSTDSSSQYFVEKIALENLDQEVAQIQKNLKTNFKYKRKEIKLDIDGALAVIATKDFDLSIFYTQDSDNAGNYIIEYQIINIKSPDALLNEGLQMILDQHFNQVTLSIDGTINFEEIIDEIERDEPEGVEIEYPDDCSNLTLYLSGYDWKIYLTDNEISIVSRYLESPIKMLDYFNDSQQLIANHSSLSSLK